jgi:Rac GTPase-activating protein 1
MSLKIRIKFGKLAFKCSDCRATCHVDCKTRMPQICVPTVQASISRGLAGTLADFAPLTVPMIPSLIVHCVNEVERRGMKEVALYRVNGSEKEITDLKVRSFPFCLFFFFSKILLNLTMC